MAGISNLNILVQQGGNAQELQQIKQQAPEVTQSVAAQNQEERAAEAKARVQDTDDSEKTCLKDDSKGKRDGRSSGEGKRDKKKKEGAASAPTGKILDTVV